MSTRLRYLDAAGVMIDERFGNLYEQQAFNFPVLARDIGTAPLYESVKVVAVNVPVKLQTEHPDMDTLPHDFLIGDINGVWYCRKSCSKM
jgi:regulator of RNase E activity RraA